MARAAVRRRLSGPLPWRTARLIASRFETATGRTLEFQVDDWPGHLPGQHVDLRLTADDGYTAQRSYSLAAPTNGDRLELTVEGLPDGEVSPFLTQDMEVGDTVELRGPIGGWFVWRAKNSRPALLIGGGSGVVPLMAMLRARRQAPTASPCRLVYSVRSPESVYYSAELDDLVRTVDGVSASVVYTRSAPDGYPRAPRRVDIEDLVTPGWGPDRSPECFVCGPTGFVESAAQMLVEVGHDPLNVRTERFGSAGG